MRPNNLLKGKGLHKSTAIIFDFGGVLMDWDPHYLFRQFFGDDPAATRRFMDEIGFVEWNAHQDRGRPFSEGVAELSRRFPAYREFIQAYDQRYEETIRGAIQPTVEILQELRQAGYRLFGLSNWAAEKFGNVRSKYPFFDWFEAIVLSGEVKVNKPDLEIFRVLLEKIGQPANQCLLIDDTPHNLQVAKKLGFQTIHYQSPDGLRAELRRMGLLD